MPKDQFLILQLPFTIYLNHPFEVLDKSNILDFTLHLNSTNPLCHLHLIQYLEIVLNKDPTSLLKIKKQLYFLLYLFCSLQSNRTF